MSASLVSARDEDDLLDTLDQVADSEGASWSVYRGPVWVDFDVPAEYRIDEKAPGEPLRPDEIIVEDVQKVEMGAFELSTPSCDHASEMHERVTKLAFPGCTASSMPVRRNRPRLRSRRRCTKSCNASSMRTGARLRAQSEGT